MLALLVTLVLLGVTSSPVITSYTDVPVVSSTEGRQALDDQIAEECGGLTFEDLFEYDFALLNSPSTTIGRRATCTPMPG